MNGLAPTILLTSALFAGSGDETFDQPRSDGLQTPYQLEIVDPGAADTSPLATSLRRVDHGLAIPTGFEHVYRLPGDRSRYVRADGALYAVFPRSVYAQTRFGDVPLIPANTVFYIGGPPTADERVAMTLPRQMDADSMSNERAISPLTASWKLDLRIEPRRAPRSGQWLDGGAARTAAPSVPNWRRISPAATVRDVVREETAETEADGTMFGDEAYRSERIGSLMRRAAEQARVHER